MRKTFTAFALSCVLQHVLTAPALGGAAHSGAVLTNVSQVLALTAAEAAEGLPVRISASVTYADATSALLFIQDETDGIFVGLEHRVPALRFGQVVEVHGQTDPGVHLRAIRRATLKVFDETRSPAVKRTPPNDIMAGLDDCDLTSVQGVVRAIGKRNGQTVLVVKLAGGQRVEAIFIDGKGLSSLWDATVQLRGVAGLRSMDAGNLATIVFYCWDRNAVTIKKPGIYDPFVGRKIGVAKALRETNSQQRICLSGRFVAETRDGIVVEDGGRQMLVMTSRPLLIRTNDRVQASGFVARRGGAAILDDAQLRIMAPRMSTNSTVPLSESPLFTRIADIRHDRGAQSKPGSPVRVRSVVTFYDRGWMLFVQDETEGIFVASRNQKFPLTPGQLVDIEGFTDPGDYAPIIVEPRITVLGNSAFPAAKPVRYDELLNGREDSQRVEINGVVRSVKHDKNGAILDLAVPGGRIKTFLWLSGEPMPLHLIDAAVRVRGVCGSYFNERRQFTGVQLYVAGLTDIDIDDPAPEDAFATPSQPISNLLQFGSIASRRVKVNGTVTLHNARTGLLVIQDPSGGVMVRGHLPEMIAPGDWVEAAGFPTTGGYTPTLSEAVVRRTGAGALLYPRAIRAQDGMSGNYDGELITIEGRLLEQFTRDSNVVLVIQSDGLVFEARMEEQLWQAGGVRANRLSTLRLTGVCSVQVNQSLTPRGFKLLLRSGSDVVVLSSPPWWTDSRVRNVVGAAFCLAMLGVTSVWLLRRKIREQTAVIRGQLEREKCLNDQLEVKVQERTVELTRANASLEEARNQLELRVAARTSELSSLNETLTDEIAVRRKTEDALRLGEERFQLLARATRDVIWDWDVKTDRVWWSDAFESSFGYSRATLEPDTLSWTRRVHPEDHDRVEMGISKVIVSHAASWADEYRFAHADGSYRHVLDRGYVVRNEAGQPIRMVGTLVDITERKEAEESLRLSEERFSKAFRGSPVPMAISTVAEGRYIDVNDAWLKMLGFSREEVIGRSSIELGIWRHPEKRTQMIEALRDNKQIRDLEVELCTRSGEGRHILGSAETIQLKGVPCIIAIFNDLTPRLHLEAQLRQAQKMEAVGQLAAGIAHDFNNILTIVQGHVGLMLSEPGEEQGKAGSLIEIRNAADRAANLTRQLLTFSRRQPVQARSLDVNEVIGNMSTMLRRLLGEQITLRYQQATSLPAVRLDLGMMEQVIMNLAVNARDAMPGGGTLTFATMHSIISEEYVWRNPEAKVGRFVHISVSDTGCGMTPDTLNRVFEPFFTTKEVGKGTGLGLATVYGIVKQHEGWIEVTSEVNRGTTFDIYLPEQESAPPTQGLKHASAPVRGGKETILLVEDEPGVRRLAENVLARHGYQVLSAADGREALDVWQQNAEQIDLLLTDMVMPQGVSGMDLAGRLRTSSPRLKVIYTSGYSVELLESEQTLNEGVNFLPKPYPAGQLAAVVRNCLDS